MSQNMAEVRANLERQVIDRATSDEQFRQQLQSDPKSALQQLGIQLPANIKLQVLQETPDQFYFVLPPKVSGQAVSDEALEAVAGGSSTWAWNCI